MADFSMSLKGLSAEAQKLIFEKDIENGDGKMTANEHARLAKFLSGEEPFPEGYGSVKEELINFARKFDVAAAEKNLSKDRKEAVASNMSEKDKKAIDTINDYTRLSNIANGEGDYTPEQREYARALLEDSPYAREITLTKQNEVLSAKNQELLAENNELKAQIEEMKQDSVNAENERTVSQTALGELEGLTNIDTNITNALKGCVNQITSLNDTIVSTCKKQNSFIESFEKGTISEKSFKDSLAAAKQKIDQAKKDIATEKEKGMQKLLEEVAAVAVARTATAGLASSVASAATKAAGKIVAGKIVAGAASKAGEQQVASEDIRTIFGNAVLSLFNSVGAIGLGLENN